MQWLLYLRFFEIGIANFKLYWIKYWNYFRKHLEISISVLQAWRRIISRKNKNDIKFKKKVISTGLSTTKTPREVLHCKISFMHLHPILLTL